jgi:hypothetical protein
MLLSMNAGVHLLSTTANWMSLHEQARGMSKTDLKTTKKPEENGTFS